MGKVHVGYGAFGYVISLLNLPISEMHIRKFIERNIFKFYGQNHVMCEKCELEHMNRSVNWTVNSNVLTPLYMYIAVFVLYYAMRFVALWMNSNAATCRVLLYCTLSLSSVMSAIGVVVLFSWAGRAGRGSNNLKEPLFPCLVLRLGEWRAVRSLL